jgi:hypothetical protein
MMITFDFSAALVALKTGGKVSRAGWNGKGMFLELVKTSGVVGDRKLLPFIEMTTAQGDLVPWTASQTDLLAEDWYLVE